MDAFGPWQPMDVRAVLRVQETHESGPQRLPGVTPAGAPLRRVAAKQRACVEPYSVWKSTRGRYSGVSCAVRISRSSVIRLAAVCGHISKG